MLNCYSILHISHIAKKNTINLFYFIFIYITIIFSNPAIRNDAPDTNEWHSNSWWKQFAWESENFGNPWRIVPADFIFPRNIPVKCLWDHWWFGNKDKGFRPYHYMKATLFPHSKQCGPYFSKAKKICEKICRVINDQKMLPTGKTNIKELTISEHDMVFNNAYRSLIDACCSVCKNTITKPGELSYVSVFDLIARANSINKENGILTVI